MRIKAVEVREIFDSRGQPTLEVELAVESGIMARAEIPSGKSRGSTEAAVLSLAEIQKVLPAAQSEVLKNDFATAEELDNFLIKLDGTADKKKLGGNLLLGISVAFWRALAEEKKLEVWELLNKTFFKSQDSDKKPLIFSNFINGGEHARNNLDLQEYLVIAKTLNNFAETTKKLAGLYEKLGDALRQDRKLENIPLGDEDGYSLDFENNFQPVEILDGLIKAENMAGDFNLGLDAAASGFYRGDKYHFEGKDLSSAELQEVYLEYFRKSELLVSIEDPLAETDLEGFASLKTKMGDKWLVGDDLTTTSPARIAEFADKGLINSVIIKPNQIGTVTETCLAINKAKEKGLKFIVSHRSGETEDNFIISLARASGADGVKIGAPLNERIAKFNELIRIY